MSTPPAPAPASAAADGDEEAAGAATLAALTEAEAATTAAETKTLVPADAEEEDIIQYHLGKLRDQMTRRLKQKYKDVFYDTLTLVRSFDTPNDTDQRRKNIKQDFGVRLNQLPANYQQYIDERSQTNHAYLDVIKPMEKTYKKRVKDMEETEKKRYHNDLAELQKLGRARGMEHSWYEKMKTKLRRAFEKKVNDNKRTLTDEHQQRKAELKATYEAKLKALYAKYPDHALIDKYHTQINSVICPWHNSYHCIKTFDSNGEHRAQCVHKKWSYASTILVDEERMVDAAKRDQRINAENHHMYQTHKQNRVGKYDYPRWKACLPQVEWSNGKSSDALVCLERKFRTMANSCAGVSREATNYAMYYVQRVLYIRAVVLLKGLGPQQKRIKYKELMHEAKAVARACVYYTCEQLGIMGWGLLGDTSIITKKSDDETYYFVPPMWGLLRLTYSDGSSLPTSTNMKDVLNRLLRPHLCAIFTGWNRVQGWHIRSGEVPNSFIDASWSNRLKALYDTYMGHGPLPSNLSIYARYANERIPVFAKLVGCENASMQDILNRMNQGHHEREHNRRLARKAINERFIDSTASTIQEYSSGNSLVLERIQSAMDAFEFTKPEQCQLAYFWREYKTDEQREEEIRLDAQKKQAANEWVAQQLAGGADIYELKRKEETRVDTSDHYKLDAINEYIDRDRRQRLEQDRRQRRRLDEDDTFYEDTGLNRLINDHSERLRTERQREAEEENNNREMYGQVMQQWYPNGGDSGSNW